MIDQQRLDDIFEQIAIDADRSLSPFACRDSKGVRVRPEPPERLRSAYAVDRDRILYSGAYRRYQGKTQVFSFANLRDEEMSNRSTHTTYVSQLSRTIGKVLGLNLELIEAIALGHDLGHPPFGHDGELALSRNCERHGVGQFHHNIESLHIVDHIAHKGQGINLTLPVRDGIISHDGEVHDTLLAPKHDKTWDDIREYIRAKQAGEKPVWSPATLEGCVVRITDTIAYIGQDIEDAIRIGIIRREELPPECVDYLGDRNSTIIDTLVKSVIVRSYGNDYVAFDEDTSAILKKLKAFNYERIYLAPNVKTFIDKVHRGMDLLFEKYIADLRNNHVESKIYRHFLNHKTPDYLDKFNAAEKVRDFIATMTDRYFNEEIKDYLLPGRF
jgi:dGTPase